MTAFELLTLRTELAQRSRWNIGYFYSGFTFWVYVAVVGSILPLSNARLYWLVGTFFIFPVALAFSRALRADPFCKGNSLGDLVGYSHMSVIAFTLPLVILACIYFPEAMLLVMAICYCVDFYVMTWAFGSPLFALHAAIRTLLVSVVWFALPEWRVLAIPLIVAAAYLVTAVLIPPLNRRFLKDRPGHGVPPSSPA